MASSAAWVMPPTEVWMRAEMVRKRRFTQSTDQVTSGAISSTNRVSFQLV